MNTRSPVEQSSQHLSALDIFLIFLRLGLTAFGGPVAHLGYFREAFVNRKQWLSDSQYADIVALCQFLPGPSSSQVGLSIGLLRGGYTGALAAWLGFTLPSALLMILFALGVSGNLSLHAGMLHGLKIAAVAVVAQAIWGMATSLCPDKIRRTLAAVAACVVLLTPNGWGQISVIIASAIVGLGLCKDIPLPDNESPLINAPYNNHLNRKTGALALGIFFALLLLLPLLASLSDNPLIDISSAYYQSGSLVFGGGHVMLPLLQAEVVPTGWVSSEHFMAGYGAAQAIPGPLFTFAAFLGAVSTQSITGLSGGMLAVVAIFLPSFLLIIGVLPFWHQLCQRKHIRYALAGINAGVVGMLVAAFYQPVWVSTIFEARDFALALIVFAGLLWWRCPSWLAVLFCASIGYFF